jgi:cysteine/O-acetylserine efflux protein
MTIATFTALIGYMLTSSFTPGPGNILALNTTSKFGWKRSKHMILGICFGYAFVQFLCTIALYQLNSILSPLLAILKYIGCIYMIWLAYQIYRSKPDSDVISKEPSFREGFLLQLVNVKIYFYITTLITAYFIPNISSLLGLFLAGAGAVSIGSIAALTWSILGITLQSFYRKHYKWINLILAIFLLYCAWNIIME